MTSTTTSSSSSIATATEQSIVPNSSSSSPSSPIDTLSIPKKPQRPLTAYHIFLQIEREYIIQTMDGDVSDQSMMENKILHDDVPQRYKNIKLMPDWYAGPGKRKKRKHRKQHGKIGFLELSKIISSRWAELEKVDPETKSYVQKIAKAEVAEYYKEMDQYKELIKDLPPSALPPKKTNKKRTAQQQQQQQMPVAPNMISSYPLMPPTMPAQLTQDIDYLLSQIDNNKTQTMLSSQFANNSLPPQAFSFEQQGSSKKMKTCHPQVQQEEENTPLTSKPIIATPMTNKRVMMPRQVSDRSMITEAYDSFKNDQPLNIDDILCQPIGTTNDDHAPPLKRTISNGSSSSGSSSSPVDDVLNSPSSVEVDLCDDEILQLWATSY